MIDNEYRWEATIHLFKDTTILKQLLLAIGVPFLLLVSLLVFISLSSENSIRYNGLIMLGLLFLIPFLFVGFFYKNRMDVIYEMNSNQIVMKMSPKQSRKNQWVNATLAIISIFNRNTTTMGIALVTSNHQQQKLRLEHIKKTQNFPEKYKIVLYDNYRSFILQCHATNYLNVKNYLEQYTNM